MITLLEAYLAAHCLVLASGAVIGKLGGRPRHRLVLARVVLLSCVLAPLAMTAVSPRRRALPAASFARQGLVRATASLGTEEAKKSSLSTLAESAKAVLPQADDARWLWLVCGLGGLWHLGRLTRDLRRIRRALRAGLALRSYGRLRLLVLDGCNVPFSVRTLRRAWIVLPYSVVSLPRALRIAVAHEGEHHRQGDCIFAYVTEVLRGAFYLNPGMHRWCRILSEFQEYSCDEVLIGRQLFSPHDYGRCLFEVAQAACRSSAASGRELAAASCIVGMARGTGSPTTVSELRGRISMLASYQSVAPKSRWVRRLTLALAVVAPLGAAYGMRGTLTGATFAPLDTSNLDAALQPLAEREVRAGLERNHARSAAVVVASVETGRILAFAEARSDAAGPTAESWTTRAFAPGSTVKPFIVEAALDAGVTAKDQPYDCRAPYEVGGVSFENAGAVAERVTTTDTLVNSINVCAIKIAQDLGPARMRAALKRFGLDAGRPGLSDLNEPLQLAQTTLGESLPVTMGTMVKAYAMLARLDDRGADTVRKMLVEVVKRGTGQKAALKDVTVAGKTGTMTGDFTARSDASDAPIYASFAGFAPAEAPKLVAFVLVEDAHASGGSAAAPIFREVVKEMLPLLQDAR